MKKKYIIAALSILVVIATVVVYVVSMSSSELFKDVDKDAPYYNDVKTVYELGLMDYMDENFFAPNVAVTYADIVKIAAKTHQLKTNAEPIVESEDVWYQAYVDYCNDAGIIDQEYDWSADVSRAECMNIFSRVMLPEELEEKNHIEDGAIPDVTQDSEYYDIIYKFYKAGIFKGTDDLYSCHPGGSVKRHEVAGIVNRILDSSVRYSFELLIPEETDDVTETEGAVQSGSSNEDVTEESENIESTENTDDNNAAQDETDAETEAPVEPEVAEVPAESENVPETEAPKEPETAPETAAPETKAPETAAPETKAPETAAPETKAPETAAPETKAPETAAPETKAPETAAPETKAPETAAPETKAPETAAPETKAPETAAPETAAPETAAPETAAPETAAPETAAPETAAPETAAPETAAPETAAPETAAPETAAPETVAPETAAPETAAPETEAPETTAPETDADTGSDSTWKPWEPETEAPETEAPETEAPETEAPETEAPETEAPETEAPETEAPETEAPETEAPPQEDSGSSDSGIAYADTPVGTVSYNKRSEKYISYPSEQIYGGYKMEVYCTTDSGSVKMATIYLDMGGASTGGSTIGYYDPGSSYGIPGFIRWPVYLDEHSPSLDGWSDADKEIYSMVYQDYRDVVSQVSSRLY